MRIGGLQKLSLSDYPGRLSAVVFTSGCNLRCPYCHNPELVLPAKMRPSLDKKDVLNFLEKRRGYIDAVVISGGEPTQHKDLPDFLRQLRWMEYEIKLDTNGTRPEVLRELIAERLVDYIAMDVKTSLAKYQGMLRMKTPVENIPKSIELICSSGLEYQFRTTVVRDVCDESDLKDIQGLLGSAEHYVLQDFECHCKMLDKSLRDKEQFREEEVDEFRRRWEKVPIPLR